MILGPLCAMCIDVIMFSVCTWFVSGYAETLIQEWPFPGIGSILGIVRLKMTTF